MSGEAVRDALRSRREIALIDVRDEHPYAQAHPLFAAQICASRIEVEAPWRVPRRDVDVVVYDDGEGLAEPAARRLQALGYTRVHLLAGGLAGWRESGGELFRDVNSASKAFGELVEHEAGTPSLPAEEVKAMLDAGTDMVVLDARRFDEYQTMSIPQGTSVPGAELVLRVRELAPNPATRVIVNCAGRTRSLIGAQSLVNAGIPNPVAALRNGTIGWTLAGFTLDRGRSRRFGPASPQNLAAARAAAQSLADRAGAVRLDAASLARWTQDASRTLYRWDVRTPEEFVAGHLPGFGSAPGGQLVQETDVFAAVRGARIALADDDGVRAPMTAHWLAQMGWEVGWLDEPQPGSFSETGAWMPVQPAELALHGAVGPAPNRYRRPYEGTDNPRAAMQAYLEWEYGLVAQLARDATHGFQVLLPGRSLEDSL
jgi:rhodanese-related sulfurtransferase